MRRRSGARGRLNLPQKLLDHLPKFGARIVTSSCLSNWRIVWDIPLEQGLSKTLFFRWLAGDTSLVTLSSAPSTMPALCLSAACLCVARRQVTQAQADDIQTVQGFLGYTDVSTEMIYILAYNPMSFS